jgi:hypothetical protein
MFEPLQGILNKHGDSFTRHLADISTRLGAVVANTRAQLEINQRQRKSVFLPGATGEEESEKVGKATLRNDSAYGWLVKWVANYDGRATIYIGSESGDGFMLDLDGRLSEEVNWYVPVNGVIFLENPSDVESYVNFEIEVLETEPVEAHTGPSNEHIERARREPTPSGTPLDTHVADDPPPSVPR